jgi:hypothetical protein
VEDKDREVQLELVEELEVVRNFEAHKGMAQAR